MQFSKLTLFGGSAVKRGILLAAFATLLASVGVTYAAITATDLAPTPGDEAVLLGLNTFVADPDTEFASADIAISIASASAAGDSQPGVEADSTLPAVNNPVTRGNYGYTFVVRETSNTAWGADEDRRVRIWSDDGTTTTLEATLYIRQATVDGGAIDGVTLTIDLGSTTTIDDRYDIVVDLQ